MTERKRKLPTYCRPVKCIETGKVWLSGKSCAEDIGVTPSYLNDHIRFDETIKGRHCVKL